MHTSEIRRSQVTHVKHSPLKCLVSIFTPQDFQTCQQPCDGNKTSNFFRPLLLLFTRYSHQKVKRVACKAGTKTTNLEKFQI